jgi:hypothetical protein
MQAAQRFAVGVVYKSLLQACVCTALVALGANLLKCRRLSACVRRVGYPHWCSGCCSEALILVHDMPAQLPGYTARICEHVNASMFAAPAWLLTQHFTWFLFVLSVQHINTYYFTYCSPALCVVLSWDFAVAQSLHQLVHGSGCLPMMI